MGKHRFRLSDMLPNAWFYKLKDMNKPHPPLPKPPPPPNQQQCQKQAPPPLIPNRASYYIPSNSPAHPKAFDSRSPRKSISSTPRPRRKLPTAAATSPRLLLPISPTTCTRTSVSVSESDSEFIHNSYCIAHTAPPPPPPKLDVVLDLVGSELDLRPILTKPPPPNNPRKKQDNTPSNRQTSTAPNYKKSSSSAGSPGRKVRVARRPSGGRRRRSRMMRGGPLEESFAVVKSSSDPRRDFRESMMEMITENKLTASNDLEDLLACYLALNSNEYHDLIVNVFQEICPLKGMQSM